MPPLNTTQNLAILLDGLVQQVGLAMSSQNVAFALEEFALGQPLIARPLDVGFGYGITNISGSVITLSPGVARAEGALIGQNTSNMQTIDTALLLGGVVTNAYAFGSVFLVYFPGDTQATFQTVLAAGGANGSGAPLLMSQDISIATLSNYMASGYIPQAMPPIGISLECIRFILDIEQYYPSTGGTQSLPNIVTVLPVDIRRPRGWGGFADETLGSMMIGPSILLSQEIVTSGTELSAALYNIISKWVSLKSWTPSFIGYWRTPGHTLPANLHTYLTEALNITI